MSTEHIDIQIARNTISNYLKDDEILRNFTVGHGEISIAQGCLLLIGLVIGIVIGALSGGSLGSSGGGNPWNESIIGLTNKRILVVVIKRRIKEGMYRVVNSVTIPLDEIKNVDLQESNAGANIVFLHTSGHYKYKIREQTWINRARTMSRLLPSTD